MQTYTPPLDDIRFILRDVLKVPELVGVVPEYKDADWDSVVMMMDEVAKFATDTALPLNVSGDREGCKYDPVDFSVKTPKGFKDAYDAFVGMGMIGLNGDPAHGGQGLPHFLGAALNEMMIAANFSLSSYPGLTAGAAKVLEKFADNDIKTKYLPKLYSGEWTGTMCLTEPQAGSDLGLIKTKAEPQADGSFKVSGSKIFITCGEHDLAENICHLVLARTPNAPPGIAGISLFLVPKHLSDDSGALTTRNGVKCTGIEHKMGIHASATCSMNFDEAKGWMIGEENKGMKAMFVLMNDARLKVGLQGLGLSEAALQAAGTYANNRVQGKPIRDTFNPAAKSVTIINHANVRKDLMELKCQVEGFRALIYRTAVALDRAAKHPDPDVKANENGYAELMTPILKSCLSDLSCAAAQKTMQLHGGMGFVTETGVEQYYRDSIIATIYEGTNDIQSMDFTFRKVIDPKSGPARLDYYMEGLNDDLSAAKKLPALSDVVVKIESASIIFENTTGNIFQTAMGNKLDETLVHSRDYMDLFGKLAVGQMWLKMMTVAQTRLDSGAQGAEAEFLKDKLQTGRYYMERVMLPEMTKLQMRIESGGASSVNARPQALVPASDRGIGRDAPKAVP